MKPKHLTRRQLFQTLAAGAGVTFLAQYAWASGNDESGKTMYELVPNEDGKVTIAAFDNNGNRVGKQTVPIVRKSPAEWRAELSTEAYRITRERGTEEPFTGAYYKVPEQHGLYRCIGCDTALFDSKTQFHSGTGWPSFYKPIAAANVVETEDHRMGMTRIEVLCTRCRAHLGHKFHDGPPPTGLRYCTDSPAFTFHPVESV